MSVDIFVPKHLNREVQNFVQNRGKYSVNFREEGSTVHTLLGIPYQKVSTTNNDFVLESPLYPDPSPVNGSYQFLNTVSQSDLVITNNSAYQQTYALIPMFNSLVKVKYSHTVFESSTDGDRYLVHKFIVLQSLSTTEEQDLYFNEELFEDLGETSEAYGYYPFTFSVSPIQTVGISNTVDIVKLTYSSDYFESRLDQSKIRVVETEDEDGRIEGTLYIDLLEDVDTTKWSNGQTVNPSDVKNSIKTITELGIQPIEDGLYTSVSVNSKFTFNGTTFNNTNLSELEQSNYALANRMVRTDNPVVGVGFNIKPREGVCCTVLFDYRETQEDSVESVYSAVPCFFPEFAETVLSVDNYSGNKIVIKNSEDAILGSSDKSLTNIGAVLEDLNRTLIDHEYLAVANDVQLLIVPLNKNTSKGVKSFYFQTDSPTIVTSEVSRIISDHTPYKENKSFSYVGIKDQLHTYKFSIKHTYTNKYSFIPTKIKMNYNFSNNTFSATFNVNGVSKQLSVNVLSSDSAIEKATKLKDALDRLLGADFVTSVSDTSFELVTKYRYVKIQTSLPVIDFDTNRYIRLSSNTYLLDTE